MKIVQEKNSAMVGTIALISSQLIFSFSAYSIQVVLGRHFGPALYGIYGTIIGTLAWVELCLRAVPTIVNRDASRENADRWAIIRAGFNLQCTISLILFLCCVLFGGALAVRLNLANFAGEIRIAMFDIMPYAIFLLMGNALLSHHQFVANSISVIAYSFSRMTFIIGLGLTRLSVMGAVIGNILCSLGAIFVQILVGARSTIGKTIHPITPILVESMPLGFFLFVHGASETLVLWALSYYRIGALTIGCYVAASTFGKVIQGLLCSLNGMTISLVSRSLGDDDYAMARNYIRQIYRIVLILAGFSLTLLYAAGAELINLFFGKDYQMSRLNIVFISLGIILMAISNLAYGITVSIKRTHLASSIAVLGILCEMLMLLLLVPNWGVLGAALALITYGTLSLIGYTLIIWRRLGFSVSFPQNFVLVLLPSLFIGWVAGQIDSTFQFVLIKALLIGIAYSLLIIISGTITITELRERLLIIRDLKIN